MISGIWEWSFKGNDDKIHVIKLDNSKDERLIYLDNVHIETIPSKLRNYFNFEYKFNAAGKECIIVNSALDNVNRKPPKLAIDGMYINKGTKYFPVPPMTIYGYVYSCIAYILLLPTVFISLMYFKFEYITTIVMPWFMCIMIRKFSNIPIIFNVSNFFKHVIRILFLTLFLGVIAYALYCVISENIMIS
ncbi:MAG: hypothetical protein J6K52_06165 [Clostridia bacterium]|nr:hypothetical protein [Clostridia bacterium]